MARIRYHINQLVEIDTETNKIRIIKNYCVPVAGSGYNKKKESANINTEASGTIIL